MEAKGHHNFRFAKFRLGLKPLETLYLPSYPGSTFRGGLGNVFKKTLCVSRDRKCENCILKDQCAYSYCFESPAGDKEKARSSHWPHPYLLEPSAEGKTTYQKGEEINLNLMLIGKGMDFLPYFVFVFDELGKSGIGKGRHKYQLEKVESMYDEGDYRPIYEEGYLSSDYKIITFEEILKEVSSHKDGRITVKFLTPTRILLNGHLIRKEMNFSTFMNRLVGRISLLSQCHCGETTFHFGDLLERAGMVKTTNVNLDWQEPERYSSRQKASMKMGGFVGQITFEGDVREFVPIIKLGEYIHVGNLTSFGLGKYEIIDPGSATLKMKG